MPTDFRILDQRFLPAARLLPSTLAEMEFQNVSDFCSDPLIGSSDTLIHARTSFSSSSPFQYFRHDKKKKCFLFNYPIETLRTPHPYSGLSLDLNPDSNPEYGWIRQTRTHRWGTSVSTGAVNPSPYPTVGDALIIKMLLQICKTTRGLYNNNNNIFAQS